MKENTNILFEHAVLRVRLEIRNFFLNASVREIYENVGQILSIVKMQLSVPAPLLKVSDEEVAPQQLVGQSIHDLRRMTKSFFPDEDILQERGLMSTLYNAIEIIGINKNVLKGCTCPEQNLAAEMKLLSFKLLLEVLLSIKEAEVVVKSISIKVKDCISIYTISYKGDGLEFYPHFILAENPISFYEALQLTGATYACKTSEAGVTKIVLKVPFN